PRPSASTLSPYTTLFRSLPPPLHKAAKDSVALKLALDQHKHLSVDYGAHTHVDLTFNDDRLQRAIILLGKAPAVQPPVANGLWRSEEHTSELQSRFDLVC